MRYLNVSRNGQIYGEIGAVSFIFSGMQGYFYPFGFTEITISITPRLGRGK